MIKLFLPIVVLLLSINLFAQSQALPDCVQDFLYSNAEAPFGKINPEAPKELEQFGQLAGVWEMTSHAEFQGQWFSGWPAIWTWKYALDGTNILDYYYRAKENTPPIYPQPVDIHALNLRVYDEETNAWSITWIANNSGEARYTAEVKNSEIWMRPVEATSPQTRIIFSEITDDSFKWRTESQDENGNWTYQFYMLANRIQ
ncbi:MAG: hypothetical protein AAFY91_04020 [Bacteroidota bacterium]